LNASRSEKSSAKRELDMYGPLSNVLNYGFECLSGIKVDGLPESRNLVFVLWDRYTPSDRTQEGSQFKPDIVLMSLATACDFYGITDRENQTDSQIADRVSEMARSKAVPASNDLSDQIGWKDILSWVEVKRASPKNWPTIGKFTDEIPLIPKSKCLDEQLLQSRPDLELLLDIQISQSNTGKAHALMHKHTAEELPSRELKIYQQQEADRE
jgi:hypothetical protein